MIYLDYNAHAPLLKPAEEAMLSVLRLHGNPSSVHKTGRQLRKLLDEARLSIKHNMGANRAEVLLTSGASEANSQVLHTAKSINAAIFISAIEHDSVTKAASGATVIPVDSNGVIDLAGLDKLLASAKTSPILVSVMAANNETGVIQPFDQVVMIAKQHGAYVHIDATQAVGRIPVDFDQIGADYMTFSSHKIGGPLGAGALIYERRAPLVSLIHGGAQEKNHRAGTENVPAIMGFAAALAVMKNFDWQPMSMLRDQLEHQIQQLCSQVVIHGVRSPRLANTSCLHMPGVDNGTQVMAFDLEGIAVSAGSACSSGKVKASTVLTAMGCQDDQARESIRISLCPTTSAADIEQFIKAWQMIFVRAQAWPAVNNNSTADQNSARKVIR